MYSGLVNPLRRRSFHFMFELSAGDWPVFFHSVKMDQYEGEFISIWTELVRPFCEIIDNLPAFVDTISCVVQEIPCYDNCHLCCVSPFHCFVWGGCVSEIGARLWKRFSSTPMADQGFIGRWPTTVRHWIRWGHEPRRSNKGLRKLISTLTGKII